MAGQRQTGNEQRHRGPASRLALPPRDASGPAGQTRVVTAAVIAAELAKIAPFVKTDTAVAALP